MGAGKLTPKAYKEAVDKYKPVDTLTKEDIIPKWAKMKEALGKKGDKINAAKDLPAGYPVGIRLDINAYLYKDTWVPTVHENTTEVVERVARKRLLKTKELYPTSLLQ